MNRRERRQLDRLRRRDDAGGRQAPYDLGADLRRALAALKAGRPREALRQYRRILAVQPNHPDALNLSGIALFRIGQVERALESVGKALAVQPGHLDARNNLGNLLKALGRLDEAEAAYRRAIEIKPDYAGAHFNLGTVLEALARPDEAEEAYRHTLGLDPDFAEAGIGRGNALKATGRLHEAVGAYRRALEQAPGHADGHNNHGTTLRELGDLARAAAAYRRALEIEPRHVDAHYNLGIVLQEQGAFDEAAAAYHRALEIDPGFTGAWVNLGTALQALGRLDEAIDTYRRAIEIAPDYPGAHVNLGDALLEAGDVTAASEACEAYLGEHPGDTSLLAWKAIVLRERGEIEAASRLVDFARFILPLRLEAPETYSNLAEFNAALAGHVTRHPSLVYAPSRHATRLGKHSGELLAGSKGPVAQLEDKICEAVDSNIRNLAADPEHPFVARAPKGFHLSAWSVVLEAQGHQVPHIHPSAWLSGVYYVELPATIARAEGGNAGWIEFGRPPAHFHCTAEPELRMFRPEEGLMLLFPSYFYHRTVPFQSKDRRISIAFDVIPDG